MTESFPDHTSGLESLVGELAGRGALADAAWKDAFTRVPRHLFIPSLVWDNDDDGWLSPVTRDDPRWWRWIYEDRHIVTQVDDGAPSGADGRGQTATSSASLPRLVARMLEELSVGDNMRVLEIGTATGYNTALLSARLGSRNVITVEIDPVLAEQGRANLERAGWSPTVVVGDGVEGVPDYAPYDRVLATVAAKNVPYAWVEQTRPGGVIVTPWGNDYLGHRLLRLEVGTDGTASGRVVGLAAFMWLRDQRARVGPWRDFVVADEAMTRTRMTLDPNAVLVEEDSGARFVIGVNVPDLYYALFRAQDDSGEFTLYLYDRHGSSALAEYEPGAADYEMRHHGPRNLWAEVEHAYRAWEEAGCPDRDRLGVTVSPAGQTVWLDVPGNPVGA
ncbi:methyltransferase domain-containing protein [Actinorugispora endophytica]|uniref:Protein-L-isoaspartate O-methyltransferase n=1 Tax=Actinorugispora endophytica TaxID=1605990 RepID=A0A4R6V7N3_9ACTN|nr:methyltransferase domain-containing protein [Actinorugispora endophytica]TDQ55109.1 protein-L-isoaspartate(D-aspartate) O-methyltransferase [Actinorugispora endophytica]